MAEWVKFDGSEEHRKLLKNACDFRLKLKDGTETALINGSCEFAMIDQILICERHPHADMIIEWARTGRPVFRKYQDGIWRIDPDPIWDKHEEYRFDPPKIVIKYKRALMSESSLSAAATHFITGKSGNNYWLDIAHDEDDVIRVSGYATFIKWLDDDWQEVEV